MTRRNRDWFCFGFGVGAAAGLLALWAFRAEIVAYLGLLLMAAP